ncbi:MAG: hypothetical protein ABIO24_02335, partial [Saprospiraceae bacterium]
MSLFNFLSKKDKSDDRRSPQESVKKLNENIELSSVDTGSHGDNLGALIGFNFFNSTKGRQFIEQIMELSTKKPSIFENDPVSIKESRISAGSTPADNLGIRTVCKRNKIVSAYPYLETDYEIPFLTKQIVEWRHAGN